MSYRLITILVLFCVFSAVINSNAQSELKYKELKIAGLKIFTEEFVIQKTNLNNLQPGQNLYASISRKISAFYQKSGFTLVRTYLLKETSDVLVIYVDEGQLGRIIFKNLNTIDIIKIRYEFELQGKIYNKFTIEEEAARIKKKYGFKDISYSLLPVTEGEQSFFQLNNEIVIPGLGPTRIPLFKEYNSRYNLEIEFIKKPGEAVSFTYGIKTSYSKGFIPDIEFRDPDFFQKNDLLIIGASLGLYYGFDLKFRNPPKWTFFETHSDYHFAPIKQYFTPMATISAYYSRASRKDLGITNYNYLKLKSILAPGITLLNNLHIYAGLGGESVLIFTPKTEPDSHYASKAEEHNETFAVFESKIKLDVRPWTLKRTKMQEFEAIYDYYKNNCSFHEINIEWNGAAEFVNLDMFLYTLIFDKIWNTPPFYHEYSVSGSDFKGFMGKGYYTRNIIKFSNEYRFSIYRDKYHLGIFADLTRFEGSGYDLTGYQNGIVSGVAGHIIFLDQFEFNVFFGKDYLYSTKESQYNIYMKFNKKW